MIRHRSGMVIHVNDWQDVTTVWVVWFGSEYRILKTDQTMIDLGANIGAFSIMAAHANNNIRIFAVEPFPSTFRHLLNTVDLNEKKGRIHCLQAASVEKDSTVMMPDDENISSHSRKVGNTGIPVPGHSLTSILQNSGWDFVDFLKVDIEGSEYGLFQGSPIETLSRIKRIGLEYHSNGKLEDLVEILLPAGFRITRQPKKGATGVVEFTQIN